MSERLRPIFAYSEPSLPHDKKALIMMSHSLNRENALAIVYGSGSQR